MYLCGEYESRSIAFFLSVIPKNRRRTILDIGANVGTHSLEFSRHFDAVHAFEPNPDLWENFERNISQNGLENVWLHRLGLGNVAAELPFFLIEKANYGLGTFATFDQYDLPLQEVGRMRVDIGDRYLASTAVGPVDAIKIDVQGFEPQVIEGLAKLLQRDQPFLWLEVGEETVKTAATAEGLLAWFPYPARLYRLERSKGRVRRQVLIKPAPEGSLSRGNYLITPLGTER